MRTIEITAYQFAELSDKAKQKALEKMYDINVHDDWFDSVYEDFKMICECLGITLSSRRSGKFDEPCIYFSGFSSQGDGACFEGSYSYVKGASKAIRDHAGLDKELHRIADNLQALQKANFYQLTAGIENRHRGYSISVDVNRYDDKAISEATEDAVKELMNDLCSWLYKSLESEYDYMTSDAAIIETIEANEYEFDENGKRI